jgi:hypothetical protein
MVAQANVITPDQAFEMLRTYCRSHGLRLTDVANQVISTPASVQDLMGS